MPSDTDTGRTNGLILERFARFQLSDHYIVFNPDGRLLAWCANDRDRPALSAVRESLLAAGRGANPDQGIARARFGFGMQAPMACFFPRGKTSLVSRTPTFTCCTEVSGNSVQFRAFDRLKESLGFDEGDQEIFTEDWSSSTNSS
jgi:hypothetical protein